MPIIRSQGPIAYSGQLVAYSDPSQDNPYTEQIIVLTENQPVQFTDTTVQFSSTSGNSAQAIYTTV